MIRTNFIRFFFTFSCILSLIFASCSRSPNYEISQYRATFELFKNSLDVGVRLEITYKIGDSYKSDGFKFVGNNPVSDLSCGTDTGEPLNSEIKQMRETKILWYFPKVKNCSKTVIANFKLKNFLRKIDKKYILDAKWAGIFKVPVERSTFEVIFPEDVDPKIAKAIPSFYNKDKTGGRYSVLARQEPLSIRELYIEYEE